MEEPVAETAAAEPSQLGTSRASWARLELLGAAGVLSIFAGVVVGLGWLDELRIYWDGAWRSGASFSYSHWARNALSIASVASGILATVLLITIARKVQEARPAIVGLYWLATITLWVALALMARGGASVGLDGGL